MSWTTLYDVTEQDEIDDMRLRPDGKGYEPRQREGVSSMAIEGDDVRPDGDEDDGTIHPDELPGPQGVELKSEHQLFMTLKVTKKANLGNYENAEASIIVSGVTLDTTDDDLDALVERGKIAFGKMAEELREQLTIIRDTEGFESNG